MNQADQAFVRDKDYLCAQALDDVAEMSKAIPTGRFMGGYTVSEEFVNDVLMDALGATLSAMAELQSQLDLQLARQQLSRQRANLALAEEAVNRLEGVKG